MLNFSIVYSFTAVWHDGLACSDSNIDPHDYKKTRNKILTISSLGFLHVDLDKVALYPNIHKPSPCPTNSKLQGLKP